MLEQNLEQIGFKKNEAIVYIALQKCGRARAYDLIKDTGLHRNLVYQSLASLIERRLIAKLEEEGISIFQPLDPSELLHALERETETTKQVVSELKDIASQAKQSIFAFEGNAGFRSAFWNMIETLKAGDELLVMGIFDVDAEFQEMIREFHTKRAEKGIKAKILINAHAKAVGEMLAQIELTTVRYLKEGIVTPAVFFIYKHKVMISLPNQRTFFRIENQEAADAFCVYFNSQWTMGT